jgi:hypothetical protein
MRRTTGSARPAWDRLFVVGLLACTAVGFGSIAAAAEEAPEAKLIPIDREVIAAREKALADAAPEGAKLVAYLDCGSQRESTTGDAVKIALVQGKPYQFPSEAAGVPPTQPTVFFHEEQIVFKLSGIERGKRYLLGLTWWDYDDGSRTESVLIGSPDARLVRLAITAIRLPNYTTDGQPPAEKRFPLPVTFAREGEMRLIVLGVTGANAVVSELWIWELK